MQDSIIVNIILNIISNDLYSGKVRLIDKIKLIYFTVRLKGWMKKFIYSYKHIFDSRALYNFISSSEFENIFRDSLLNDEHYNNRDEIIKNAIACVNNCFEKSDAILSIEMAAVLQELFGHIYDEINGFFSKQLTTNQRYLMNRINRTTKEENENTRNIILEMEERLATKYNINKDIHEYNCIREAIIDSGGIEDETGGVFLNISMLTRELLNNADSEDLQYMKKQLGKRLKGDESREEIITFFWAELHMSFQCKKRNGVMPLFQDVIRDVCDATVFNEESEVIDRVSLAFLYWEEYDVYRIIGEKYLILLVQINRENAAYDILYDFSDLKNVRERLFYLERIKKYTSANEIRVVGKGQNQYTVLIDFKKDKGNWAEQIIIIQYWNDLMKKIELIENYYDVKFLLPEKLSESEKNVINILINSIEKKASIILPGITMDFFREIEIEFPYCLDDEACDETGSDDVDGIDDLVLLGHVFQPVKQYLVPCELVFNKTIDCVETLEGGIPLRVEYTLKK